MPPDSASQRLFLAIVPPPDIVNLALQAQGILHTLNPDTRCSWIPPQNIHLTMKFFGDLWPDQVESLKEHLCAVLPKQPGFKLQLGAPNCFPDLRQAHVAIWDVLPEPRLITLHALLEQTLSAEGIPAAQYPYYPHLTLARIRQILTADFCLPTGFMQPQMTLPHWHATEISLFQSHLKQGGPEYLTLETYPLQSSEA